MDFADDIPERDINSGDRSGSFNPAPVPEVLSPHHLPEMLYPGRIFTDQELGQIFNRTDHAPCVPFQSGLAPANQARLIGDHFDENPVTHPGMADKRFNRGDFHSGLNFFDCTSEICPMIPDTLCWKIELLHESSKRILRQ
jgi:hypothetical protein